ncbi:MAG: ferrous iron transport protein B [Sedimentisphaerales bacterium]|nr:ferrous iron transport protein B [Sedimentisphaerales bacterium]
MKKLKAALAGNPNSGKTTIFNLLTGSHQHVGNYPGVTVEEKYGVCRYGDYEITFVDLPGTYSLTAYSEEELITRNYIINEKPDVVVDIIDASGIERNLYLSMQLMDLDIPLVLVFNMSDIAEQRGLVFNIEQLSVLFEAKIVKMVGNKGKGKQELLEAVIETSGIPGKSRIHKMKYGDEIENELEKIEKAVLTEEPALCQIYQARWLSIKLLEQDDEITKKVQSSKVNTIVESSVNHLKSIFRESPEIIMAGRRYGYISGACQETIKTTAELSHNYSDMIDAVVTHRILGLPIFLVLMYLTFFLTFKLGSYPMSWLEHLFGWAGENISGFWEPGSNNWLKSLLVDGIIGGVGGVIVFLPNILILFMMIAFLEDSGYMARAAFIMDRIMHKIGLHGKSFIPMLIGFGCSVPAIMATRILENKRNRLATIMVIPLMSCGAKLTIYALIIPAFFEPYFYGPMMWLIYLIGIILAVICIKLLRLTIFKGETVPFVMELPPYRLPTFKSIAIHMWQRGWMYLKKAGTIILAASIILWFAMSYPKPDTSSEQGKLEYSAIGRLGKVIEPAIKPLGFDWKIGTALIGATAAKELFVSQMAIAYSVSDPELAGMTLREKLSANYTPLTGFCIMLFCLIYAPCIATIVMTKQETNSWRWAMFQFFGLTALAYIITFIVYQMGSLIFN